MATLDAPVPAPYLVQVFRDAADALLRADVPFAVAGSLATWAHGGPEPPLVDDIDVVVRESDVVAAARALRAADFAIRVPPEGWLFKAFHELCNGDGEHVFVDVITCMTGLVVDDEVFERARTVHVAGISVRSLAPIDQMTGSLMSIMPAAIDYSGVMEKARILREQFDWAQLEERAAGRPVALGFFDVARRLGVDPRSSRETPAPAPTAAPNVRTFDSTTRAKLQAIADGDED